MTTSNAFCTRWGRFGVCGLALAGAAQAQTFQAHVGTARDEWPFDIEETFEGGWVTAGLRTGDPIAGGVDPADFFVVRYDPLGMPMWATQFGGFGTDVAYSVHQTMDGGFIVAGMTESAGAVLGLGLVRLDPAGGVVWSFVYTGDVFGELFNPVPDGVAPQVAVRESRVSGDIIVVTNHRSPAGGQHGMFLRTTAAGAVLIHREYFDSFAGPLGRMAFNDLKELPDGTIAISGFITGPTDTGLPPDVDVLAMRTAPFGTPLWAFAYGDPTSLALENGYGVDVSPDGLFWVVGAGTDRGFGVPAAQHHWLDGAGGAPLFNTVIEGFVPSYAATRFDRELNAITGGANLFLPAPAFRGAVGVSHSPGGALNWLGVYGPTPNPVTGSVFRAEAVAPSLLTCGAAFTGPRDTATGALPLNNQLIKVNDKGRSGCCEDLFGVPREEAPVRQIPLAFTYVFYETAVPWGTERPVPTAYFPDCVFPTCDPCPIDLDGNGLFNLDDVTIFVTLFTSGDLKVDFTCDGVLNLDDIIKFTDLVAMGC